MAFGAEIKRLREDAHISVKKIADKIGVNADRWRKWEEKDLTPRLEDALVIESYFGMELSKIVKLPSIKQFLIVPRETKEFAKVPNTEPLQFDLIKEVIQIRERQLVIQATLAVVISELTPLIAKGTGRSHANVFSQMKKDIELETLNLRASENKKKQ